MKKIIGLTTVGVSGLFLVIACAGKNGRFGDVSGTIPESFARAVLEQPLRLSEAFVGNVPSVRIDGGFTAVVKFVNDGLFRMSSSPFADCKATSEGDKKDSDSDELPVDAKLNVDCASPNESLKAKWTMKDQNDAIEFPRAGVKVNVETISGRLANKRGGLVDFNLTDSNFDLSVAANTSQASGSGEATLKVGAASLALGFEGSGSYTGNINARREGDKAIISGKVKYAGSSISEVPDAEFVGQLDADLTMGDCGGGTIMVKSGKATLRDGRKNTAEAVVTNCVAVISYNGTALPVNGRSNIELPKY